MTSLHSPKQNHLLAALPATEFELVATHLELIELPRGEMLYEPGGNMMYAYFPTTAFISLHYAMESGASAESAGVGNEGVVGTSLFMGTNTTANSAVANIAGYAYRMQARLLKQEFHRAGSLQRLLLRYTETLISQLTVTAACNRHHAVEKQLCRWLLLALDRFSSLELIVTQELIASMLGVRREGVVEAARKLQEAGFIRYRRGHITVLNRSRLEQNACECYHVVKKEMSRFLGDIRTAEASSRTGFREFDSHAEDRPRLRG